MILSWSQTLGFVRTATVMVAQTIRLNVSARRGAAINGGVVMNDLVKEVFVAIRANTAATVTEAETAARAAIAAVAEWLRQELSVDEHEPYVAAALMKQLEQPK